MKKLLLAVATLAAATSAAAMPDGAGFRTAYYPTQGACQQAAAEERRESRTQNGDWFFVCLYDDQFDAWRMWTNSRRYYQR